MNELPKKRRRRNPQVIQKPSKEFITRLPAAIKFTPQEASGKHVSVTEEPSYDSDGNQWVKIGDYTVNINTVTK